MIRPDLIISWPISCDYPLWREFIRDNRHHFNQVFIQFTETNQGEDYRAFIIDAMHIDDCIFTQPIPLKAGEDWRDVAINDALRKSTAEWVWFTEQDFSITKPVEFWEFVNMHAEIHSVVGTYDADRLHPCCIFAKRSLIEKTSKKFGIVPDKLDHFGIFQKELEAMNIEVRGIPSAYWHHMNGLSHNMTLAYNKQPVTYQPEEFFDYLKRCLHSPIGLDYRTIRFIVDTLPQGMR